NYAFSSPIFEIHTKELGEIPFDSHNPPLVLKAKMKKIAWGLCEGFDSVCRKTPESRTPLSDEQTLELYPYGCAKLRMTEIPLI
ncbi:MAG: hypothetical protein IKM16_04740, partial [Clostridia bacterium]|nr:hypothetical protein [Clostridia bacterium]